MSEKFAQRDAVKAKLLSDKRNFRHQKEHNRKQKMGEWQKKMKRSPFMVDLLAENERIDEENRIRLREEMRREKALSKQKSQVKNEIILKALAESSDLDALRSEKKAIQMEEKRLKALLDLEKTNAHRKEDLLTAQRAEKQRKMEVANYKRGQRIHEKMESDTISRELLMQKLAIKEPKHPGTFSSFDADLFDSIQHKKGRK
jgi:hypothetical protein